MSVATEIQRIQSAKGTIKSAIEAKGVTVPSGATLDTYGTYIGSIETGGSGGNYEQQFIDLIERDITSVTIPNGTKSIGYSAFSNCYSLTNITIPNSITNIGNYAFYFCSKLTSVTIPDTVTSIGDNAFQNCIRLKSIDIPNSVTKINGAVFSDCTSITDVNIPNSVTSIGNAAFQSCSALTSVEIPDSVTSIGLNAFFSCSGLTSITIQATTPPTLGSNVFGSTNNCPIYVPAESVDAYKAATNWSSYASRIQAIPTV
jgi:hypothetical protein